MHKRLLEVVKGISLPLTEGACAPLVTKQHYLARILHPWLPVDGCVRAVNQARNLWPFRSKPSHTHWLPLGYTLRTAEGMPWRLGQPACFFLEFRIWSTEPGSPTHPMKHWWGQEWDWGGCSPSPCHGSPPWGSRGAGGEVRPAPVSWERGTGLWERTWRAAQE